MGDLEALYKALGEIMKTSSLIIKQ
jgi:hypothetical protein